MKVCYLNESSQDKLVNKNHRRVAVVENQRETKTVGTFVKTFLICNKNNICWVRKDEI